jgi:hypothetical protein
MQSPQPHQMALGTATTCDLCDQFQGFSKLHQLARVGESLIANLIPSNVYQPLGDCTCGRQIQRFPNCAHRHDCAESHGQSMSQVRNSKRIDHHLGQKLRAEKVELHDDMEFEQIY